MCDAEELSVRLNALYDENIQYDMLALIYEANTTTIFAVKTQMELQDIPRLWIKFYKEMCWPHKFQVTWLKTRRGRPH